MEAAKAIAKIEEDFEGAKVHWGKHFDKWVFVHNATDGLPPHVRRFSSTSESENEGIAWTRGDWRNFRSYSAAICRTISLHGLARSDRRDKSESRLQAIYRSC